MGTLLLTGSGGFIGSRLLERFSGDGWKIIALVREIPSKQAPGVTYYPFDLKEPRVPALTETIDLFIHAAYVKEEKSIDAFAINLAGTESLLRFAAEKQIPHSIFISSLSAKANASSVYGRQKYLLEEKFLAQNGTVIRAGLVLGNGGLFASMRNYLQHKRIVPVFGNGAQPVQFVHVDDLAEAISRVVAKNLRGRFTIASDEPVPYREFYRALCDSLGVTPRFVRIPFGPAKMLLGISGAMGLELPVTKDNLLGLQQMERVSSAGDLQALGLTLRNLRESLRS